MANLNLSEFDFDFPRELIAMAPQPRGQSRMMVVSRNGTREPEHRRSHELISFLNPGDALVINETRVLPAKLRGEIASGASVEILLLSRINTETETQVWEVLHRSSNPCRPGTVVHFKGDVSARFERSGKLRVLSFDLTREKFDQFIGAFGEMPLPPYIRREVRPEDRENYQSVFARQTGSAAAPTASLHFSQKMLSEIEIKGVHIIRVLLHVGYGTFSPVKTTDITRHVMHREWYDFPVQACEVLKRVKEKGGRIFAVGTTAARVLETSCQRGEIPVPGSGWTDLFIYPGYQWRMVDGLLTNFHWPKSTLFMLVCSLLGTNKTKELYKIAMDNHYRFFSYGDSQLIF